MFPHPILHTAQCALQATQFKGDHRSGDSYLISHTFKRLLFTYESQLIKTNTKNMNILNTRLMMMTFSCIQIIGTKWKFHACPASRYALRVSVGKNPRKLSLSGRHSGLSWDYRLDEVGNYYSPLSGVLNQDFRAEPAFCPPRGNLFAFLPLNSFLHHLDHVPGDLETLAAIWAVTELAHSLVAELIDDGIRTFPISDRGTRGWYRARYSEW